MNDLRKRKELCDVVLCVGQREINAHKVVLASFSPYFYAMFTNDVIQSRQSRITLKCMDPRSVKLLIEFAYMAQIRIAEENVYKCMYKASCFPRYNRTSGQQEPIKLEVLANSADLACEEGVL